MNIFRLVGDMLHLASILLLLYRIYKFKSCAGVSLKSQILYAIVFSCRYLDLFVYFVSFYNTTMKLAFLTGTFLTIYLIAKRHRVTYDQENDTFNLLWALVPTFVLSLGLSIWNWQGTMELLWDWSLNLEAVTIMPQLWMLQKGRNHENFTLLYIFCLGSYRGFYLLNWIYRYATENDYFAPEVWVPGIVQTALCSDFFYYYVKSLKEGRVFELPTPG